MRFVPGLLVAVLMVWSSSLPAGEPAEQESLLSTWEATRSSDEGTRRDAIHRLEKFGSSAVPLLMEIWHRGNASDTQAAGDVLLCLKPASKVIFAELKKDLLTHPDRAIREAAAITLPGIKGSEDEAVDALVEAFKDKDRKVVDSSVISLGEMGPSAGKACPQLLELVKRGQEAREFATANSDPAIAIHAVKSLAKLNPQQYEQAIVGACLNAAKVSRKDFEVMFNAVLILGRMGAAARPALTVLLEIADEDDGFMEVRQAACNSIQQILKARIAKQ
jgi:HEAT repeat protein